MILIMLGKPTNVRSERRQAAARREILDAAWEVARERGVAQLTLTEVASRVGMRPPSLYSHFASKAAIYDAMFAEGWSQLLALVREAEADLPEDPRAKLERVATLFFDFSVSDGARFTLMNQRTLKDFVPSPEAYAHSVAAFEQLRGVLATAGIDEQADVDLAVAILGGLANAQLANDPGGDRYRRLVPAAVAMYAAHVGT